MECQCLFSVRNKKKKIHLSFAKNAQKGVKFNQKYIFISLFDFVCVEVLRPSQPNGVM